SIENDLFQKGDKCRDKGDYDDAIKHYKKAIEYRPGEARDRIGDAYIRKGDRYRQKLKVDAAAKNYEMALEYTPDEAQRRLDEILQKKRPADEKEPSNFMNKHFRSQWKRVKDTAAMPTFREHEPALTGSYFPSSTPFSPYDAIQATPSTPNATNADSTSSRPSNTKDLVALFETADTEKRVEISCLIKKVIAQFDDSSVSFETVQELAVVATIPDKEIFTFLINQMIKALKDLPVLNGLLLQGLAVMLNSCPEDIDFEKLSGVFLDILRPLMDRLEIIRTDQNTHQLIPLLEVLNALLGTMVGRNVRNLDRTDIYVPLISFLDRLVTHKDDAVSFLATYTKQTVAFIGDNESTMMNFFRRGKLVVAIAGNIATMAQLHRYGSIVAVLQDIAKLCDFTLRYAWYQGLLCVDCMIGLEDWTRFERFVLDSKLNKNRFFLQGVCLRLEQIAATHANKDIRNGARKFLQDIEENFTGTVKKIAGEALERLKAYSDPDVPRTDTTNPSGSDARAFQDGLRPVWDPIWQATPASILFKAVQEKQHRNETILGLPRQIDGIKDVVNASNDRLIQTINNGIDQLLQNQLQNQLSGLVQQTRVVGGEMEIYQTQGQLVSIEENVITDSSLRQIHSALYAYYTPHIAIQRVSGEELDSGRCYFNLVCAEGNGRRQQDQNRIQEGISSHEGISRTNRRDNILPENLFDERDLHGGRYVPKKILIQGRAGIGKTTLCKRLVSIAQSDRWGHLFDAVLWIPLRQLKSVKGPNIESLLREEFFPHHSDGEKDTLMATLRNLIRAGKVLFILDGLDEITAYTQPEQDIALEGLLKYLCSQNYVVVTSRPYGAHPSIYNSLDLQLETVGFSPDNINKYIYRYIDDLDATKAAREFVLQNPSVQDLFKIPIQLDVFCYSFDLLPVLPEEQSVTMTLLYQTMVWKLFCKDGAQLQKESNGKGLTLEQFKTLQGWEIESLMENEIQYLSYLAYKGMQKDCQIEFMEEDLQHAMDELNKIRGDAGDQDLPRQLLERLKTTTFLRASGGDHDMDIDGHADRADHTWHFLHLTFQEYFAAVWVARMLEMMQNANLAWAAEVDHAVMFVQDYKKNPGYEAVFQMVAGVLKYETSKLFIERMQGSKDELASEPHQKLLVQLSAKDQAAAGKMEPQNPILSLEREDVKGYEQQKRDKARVEAQKTNNSASILSDDGIYWERNNINNILPEDLFDKRDLPGREGVPKKILIQGRAGIGKTTLCKRLVKVAQAGKWRDLFDAVLWIPLRQLRAFRARDIEGLLREKFFPHRHHNEKEALVAGLAKLIRDGKVLFILEGLDEIVADAQTEQGIPLKEFMRYLLNQEYVVITSRPSGVDASMLLDLDLELETIGFSPKDINNYVKQVLENNLDTAKAVLKFIEQNPSIKDLVKIPVQLDVVCYSWDLLPVSSDQSVTMTLLYQTMVHKLFCKDGNRLQKKSCGGSLTIHQFKRLRGYQIENLMEDEIEYLSYLAYKAMQEDYHVEFKEKDLGEAMEELDEIHQNSEKPQLPLQLIDQLKDTSFLHTADGDLTMESAERAWYFLHLTFQEYFAASWVVRMLEMSRKTYGDAWEASVNNAVAFIQHYKRNARYEIVFQMVAGLLKCETLQFFFEFMQESKSDMESRPYRQLLIRCWDEAQPQLKNPKNKEAAANVEKHLGIQMRSLKEQEDQFAMET
ncbi:hypothetical protein BGZ80_005966, partial [Entomortierella chlamydospora]